VAVLVESKVETGSPLPSDRESIKRELGLLGRTGTNRVGALRELYHILEREEAAEARGRALGVPPHIEAALAALTAARNQLNEPLEFKLADVEELLWEVAQRGERNQRVPALKTLLRLYSEQRRHPQPAQAERAEFRWPVPQLLVALLEAARVLSEVDEGLDPAVPPPQAREHPETIARLVATDRGS
jgi:hypothetical protein